jgi:hypothetical protein
MWGKRWWKVKLNIVSTRNGCRCRRFRRKWFCEHGGDAFVVTMSIVCVFTIRKAWNCACIFLLLNNITNYCFVSSVIIQLIWWDYWQKNSNLFEFSKTNILRILCSLANFLTVKSWWWQRNVSVKRTSLFIEMTYFTGSRHLDNNCFAVVENIVRPFRDRVNCKWWSFSHGFIFFRRDNNWRSLSVSIIMTTSGWVVWSLRRCNTSFW